MEKYVFLKSSDSVRYFPDNKPYNFRVHLENNIDLRGYWKIEISEIFTLASPKKNSDGQNHVKTNFHIPK